MSIEADVQRLTPGTIIDLYEVDTGDYGQGVLRYSPFANEMNGDIVFNNQVYFRMPVKVEGFKKSSKGVLARPVMYIANIGGFMNSYLRVLDYLRGCKVTRIRTLSKYLDSVNFDSGYNPTADPTAIFPLEVYYIDRKSGENPEGIALELAVSWDVTGVMLPLRQVIRDTCQWQYRGVECGYQGPHVAKFDNTPLLPQDDPQLDACSKTMVGCKLRYGNNPLPASFFPAVGLIRG